MDRWNWGDRPARAVVWGVARDGRALRTVTLRGAGAPRELAVTPEGAFAAVLAPSVDPAKPTFDVTLADGTIQRGRPGEGLTPRPRQVQEAAMTGGETPGARRGGGAASGRFLAHAEETSLLGVGWVG